MMITNGKKYIFVNFSNSQKKKSTRQNFELISSFWKQFTMKNQLILFLNYFLGNQIVLEINEFAESSDDSAWSGPIAAGMKNQLCTDRPWWQDYLPSSGAIENHFHVSSSNFYIRNSSPLPQYSLSLLLPNLHSFYSLNNPIFDHFYIVLHILIFQ